MIVGCHGDGLMNHLGACACLNCLVHSWKREAVILHALYEMAHNLGPGINSSFTDHLGAPRSQPRRKSKIMAGYCRPPLSRKAVYCFFVFGIQRCST